MNLNEFVVNFSIFTPWRQELSSAGKLQVTHDLAHLQNLNTRILSSPTSPLKQILVPWMYFTRHCIPWKNLGNFVGEYSFLDPWGQGSLSGGVMS